MPKVRTSGAAFLVGFTLLVAFAAPVCAARDLTAPALHGTVRDALGGVLGEVEILVLGNPAGSSPLAVARTDDHGRFFVAGVVPGIYQIAAIKHGYLAFLGRFNTLFRDSLDLVLFPSYGEKDGSPAAPEDNSWVLRLPERSLLRETEAADLLRREGDEGSRIAGTGLGEMIEGQFDHLVDLGVSVPGAARENGDTGGAETRMSVGSAIGGIGSIRVHGERASFDRVAKTDGDSETASRDASSFLVEASCATGRDASLEMKASYVQGETDLAGGGSLPGVGFRHARRAWGYDATWSAQIDDASRVAVKVGYLDTQAEIPDAGLVGSTVAGGDGSRRPFLSRAMAARGSFDSLAASRHQVHVDLEATFHDLPLPQSVAVEPVVGVVPADAAAWNVLLRAEDQWVLTAPLALVYGVGLARGSDPRQTSVVEPRVGAVWSDGTLRASLVVLYDFSGSDVAASRAGVFDAEAMRGAGSLGYEAEVEVPLPWGLRLKGAQSLAPVAFDASGVVWERIDPGFTPIFAADGSVSAERGSLTLSHDAGGTRTYLDLLRGTVDGSLAQIFPFEVPLQLLADRHLRYTGGRFGVRVASWGTDVSAEFRRVEDTLWIDASAGRTSQEFVELHLAQDLLRGEPRGMSWRFLFAARTSPQRQATDAETPAAAGSRTLAALSRRVSAGVSLAF
jgi:hypothetical protein